MLHEILLSLSGHRSPLLNPDGSEQKMELLSPPEKALLTTLAHLSNVHCDVIESTKKIATTHSSSICQAVATSINSIQLARFQETILQVEAGILRRDPGSVGAYSIVPLTTIVGEFSEWTRRMDWFWTICQFMQEDTCTGADIIDRLCDELQTGYSDIGEATLELVKVAEIAWLRQASAWLLYGRLPSHGGDDYFIKKGEANGSVDFTILGTLLPAFVSQSTAESILFIGRSLNHIRVNGSDSLSTFDLVPLHLQELSALSYPITTSGFSITISNIRLSLSQKALSQLLPLHRIQATLLFLREFFLLGRGEFANALIHEAEEKSRGRWHRSEKLAHETRVGMRDIVLKDIEVSAVLSRTFATLSTLQRFNDDDDEELDLARDILRLTIVKSTQTRSHINTVTGGSAKLPKPAFTPFDTLLLSLPTTLDFHIPSPLDLFITPADVRIYSSINSYLLSIRQAHLRLTELWKMTSIRRNHPAPLAPPYGYSVTGRAIVKTQRTRASMRSNSLRRVWATSSAALFLLSEIESYFHGEVMTTTWTGFNHWLTNTPVLSASSIKKPQETTEYDIWTTAGESQPSKSSAAAPSRDPQTLSDAHRKCIFSIMNQLLLTISAFTDPLYYLLQQIDHLVGLVYRIHSIWQSLDLEEDDGVVDAFSDFHKEEKDVMEQLDVVSERVKKGVEDVISNLRQVDDEKEVLEERLDDINGFDEDIYVPARAGKVDRLLMKLDFGGWFDPEEKLAIEGDCNDDMLAA